MRSKCKARRVAKDTDQNNSDDVTDHMTESDQSDVETCNDSAKPSSGHESLSSLIKPSDIPPDFVMPSTSFSGLDVQGKFLRNHLNAIQGYMIPSSISQSTAIDKHRTANRDIHQTDSVKQDVQMCFGNSFTGVVHGNEATGNQAEIKNSPKQEKASHQLSQLSQSAMSIRHEDFSIKQDSGRVSVWTNIKLEAGRLIGPFQREADGRDQQCASRCDHIKLMKYIQQSDNTETSNLMAVHIQNQLYYRAIRELQAGEEMLLYAKDRLYQEQEMGVFAQKNEEGETIPCGECGEVFKNKISLQRHQAYSCNNSRNVPDYGKSFHQSDDEVKSSVDENHSPGMEENDNYPSDGEFKCEECPRSFGLKSNLARHQIVHESGRRFSCEHCDRHFTDPSNLQRHIRSQHHGARCHTCTDCGKTFATSSGLKQHQHIHSSVKPFQCEVCLKAYTQFSNLCRHKRMHADCRQQIKCNDCGQAFSTITSLSKHKRFCEGALRSGMRLGTFGGDAKLSAGSGLMNSNQTPFSPAMMMGLYGSRPPFPFYPPGLSSLPMFPSGHPLAALTSLSPSNMRSQGMIMTPEKHDLSPAGKFEKRAPDGSDGGSDLMSGSDLDNIPSDSESEKSIANSYKSTNTVNSLHAPVTVSKPTPFYPHMMISPKYELSQKSPSVKSSPSPVQTLTKIEQMNVPFDLSKPCKQEHVTPKFSPMLKAENKATNGEQPLDLTCSKINITPPEAPRKTHIFGEVRSPVIPEPRLHYAYPQFPSQLMMEQALRLAENKDKSPETVNYMQYPRFPFSSPPQYPVGINPFGFVSRESPKSVASLSSLSPQTKQFPDFSRSPSQQLNQYSTPNKLKDRYSCKFCGKIFPRSANLTRHLRTHTGEQPYKCKYCERSFSISSNLQRHVRNIHNKEKPFRCPLCDRCFGQQTNLDRHLKKHETDGLNVVDSPENMDIELERENELEDKDESYFSEIRNFIGKATNSNLNNSGADINQNSLSIDEMKLKMNHFDQEKFDDDDMDEEIDPVSDDFDDKSVKSDGKLEIEHEMKNVTDELAQKNARVPDQLLMSGFQGSDDPLPLCKKPGFELKRGFSPVMCS